MTSDRIDSSNDEAGAAARRIDLARHHAVRLPPLTIDPPTRQLRHDDGRSQLLEPRMMQVLIALADAKGAILSRDDLIACCWDGRFVGDEAISSVIYRVRKTLKELAGEDIQVETIAKVGFRLIQKDAAGLSSSSPPAWLSRKRLTAASVAIIALVLVGLGLFRSGLPPFQAHTQAPPAIAVLPFEDISAGHQDAYFAEGMSEQIMSQLSVEPELRVIGKTSAAMIDRSHGIEDARARLGVTHVLEGSVRRNGQELRVDVRLVDARNGRQLWSEEFDRTLGDVFAIQDDIGRQVLSRLQGTFSAKPRTPSLSTKPEVYDLYLAAIVLERQDTEPALGRARTLLEKASVLDPNYAPAFAELSLLEPTDAKRALSLARRAIELAPELADAQTAMGQAIATDRDWASSIPYFNRAISLDPGNYRAWRMLADFQFQHLCRPREAIASLRRAEAIEPLGRPGPLIWDLMELGDFSAAETVIRQYAPITPDPDRTAAQLSLLAQAQGDLSTALVEALKAGKNGLQFQVQIYRTLGMKRKAAAVIPAALRAQVPPDADDPRAAKWAMALGDDLWTNNWTYLSPGSTALLRAGRSDWLVNSFDRNFASVDAFDQALGCKQLPDLGAHIILALRQQGRTRDADRLLKLAMARYDEARRAGYKTGWDYVAAALLTVAGRRDSALETLNRATVALPDLTALEDPSFDPLRNDPRFRAIDQRVQARIAQERKEFAQAERSARPKPA